jgi:hypothetical protein
MQEFDNLTHQEATEIASAMALRSRRSNSGEGTQFFTRASQVTIPMWAEGYEKANLSARVPIYVVRDSGSCQGMGRHQPMERDTAYHYLHYIPKKVMNE